MFPVTQCAVAALFLMTSLVGAAPYSKYGRSCKDIGCLSNQVCVMNEDPCTIYSRDHCGRYPTCQSSSDSVASCTSLICPSGQYCRTENGRPTCVNTIPGSGFDSAGVSTVNGQPSQTNVRYDNPPSVSSNQNTNHQNPYANANAPPIEHAGTNYHVSSGSNLGYPSYPSSNTGTNSGGNSGYPPYPSSNTGTNSGSNLGYPPYPSNTGTNSGTNLGYPPYPSSNTGTHSGTNLGYPPYPSSNSGSNWGYPANPSNGYRANSDFGSIAGSSYGTGSSSSSSSNSNGRTIYGSTNNEYPGYTGQNNPSGYPGKRSGSSVTTPMISLVLISFVMVAKYFS